MSIAIFLVAVFTVMSYLRLSSFAHAEVQRFPPALRHAKHGSKGAVSSENRLCSEAGVEMLRVGGNAADAMVATVFCVGVIGMYHSGIGGGGFALVRRQNGTYDFIDFREVAPAAAFEEMFVNDIESSVHGGNASAVPGELRGLQHISDTYGRLPWRHLLRPAITLAKRGFPVGHDLVRYMDFGNTSFLVNDLAWSQDFAPNGTRVGIGDYMTRRRYAHVLEKIAKHGAETFYTGDIAETTTAAIKQAGGIITKDDLASYTVKIRTPLSISYRDFRIIGCEAPSSGAVTLSAMKVIEGYNDIGNPELVNLNTHRIIEAAKFGYGMRPELGDPSFLNGSRQYQERMISAQIANQHRAKLSDYHTLNTSEYNIDGLQNPYDDGTSHMVAADNEGMVISLTTTINNPWGSYIIVNDTGIILNNQMNDFSVPGTANGFGYVPAPANFIRPGKTPLSSMSPVIIEHLTNSTFYLATGSAGGSRIITAVLQILWNVLDRSLDVKEALSTPRFHDQLVPNQTLYEYAYDNDTVGYLSALGHNATWVAPGATEAEAIRRTYNGAFEAAADPNLIEGAGIIL